MAHLSLDSGGHLATLDNVRQVDTPLPTRTWNPIPHDLLIERVRESLTASGHEIVNEQHALWKAGLRYFGIFELAGSDGADHATICGVRNSHDKRFPAALALGSGVFVCDNLAFSGEIKLARKHTRHITRDLPQLVSRAVGLLGDYRIRQEARIDAYRAAELDDRHVHDLLIRSVDARVLPVTRIPAVLADWRHPRHAEFEPRTGWSLFNCFTEILKGNIGELPKRTTALHGLLDLECGVVDPVAEANANVIDGNFSVAG